jgi:hypothetical protein
MAKFAETGYGRHALPTPEIFQDRRSKLRRVHGSLKTSSPAQYHTTNCNAASGTHYCREHELAKKTDSRQ